MSPIRTLTGIALSTILAVALVGCAAGSAEPTASPSITSAPTTSATATAMPEPTEAPAVLPTDCTTLATDATRQETVGDMTLQGDGVGFVRPAPANASLALGCDWIIEEVSGVLLLISTADPADVASAADALPGSGWTCGISDDFGATFCSLTPADNPDEEDLVVARDGVWIYLETYNRNARAFLSEIATQIWG